MNEQKSDFVFKIHEQILKNENDRRKLLFDNASLLQEIQKDGNFNLILGDENAPWSAYLGQIEAFYSRNKVNSLISVFKKLSEFEIKPELYFDIPLTRLVTLKSLSTTKQNALDWIEKARILLSKDWDIELRKFKGLLTEDDEHEHVMSRFQQCELCGFKCKDENHTTKIA